jgi:hypothetical protein
MKRTSLILALALLAAPAMLIAQTSTSYSSPDAAQSSPPGAAGQPAPRKKAAHVSVKPLSRIALEGGVSPLGVQMQTAINLSSHFNARGTGNLFNYSTNFTTNGITATAKLNLASAGAALDVYPFHAGFRLSPGVLFYNQNRLTAVAAVPGGTSFTLNGTTYYSANVNSTTGATPVSGNGTLGLNTNKVAFTATTGWGNMIPQSGRHWSFPFEIGAAFTGAPALNVNLGGWACYDQAQTQCANITGNNPIGNAVQSNLTAQVAKWTTDLNPLKTYPIVSFGVAYNFRIR